MNHLQEHPQSGYLVVSQNVQDLKHPAELFQTILENFYENHRSVADRLIQGGWRLLRDSRNWLGENVESVGAGAFKVALRNSDPDWQKNWKQHADETLRQLRAINKPVLLIVDELPDLVLNMRGKNDDALREFLAWFRKNRQTPPPARDSIRWLIGGSINLASTLDDLGEVDLINDIATETLPILSEAEVKEFVKRMLSSRGVEISETVPRRVSDRLGRPIPFFMQLATQEIFRSWKKKPRKVSSKDVDVVFDEMVTSQAAQAKLQHYYTRIRLYYRDPRRSAAYLILSQLSQATTEGVSRRSFEQLFQRHLVDQGASLDTASQRDQFNQLMRDLENDFYVIECGMDHFDFSSGVMKAWWKKYYG